MPPLARTAQAVSAGNVPTIPVIFTAQIINGFLLPCLTVCLFLCLNDTNVMPAAVAPTVVENVVLLFCVTFTIFLAGHLLLEEAAKILGSGDSTVPRGNTTGNATGNATDTISGDAWGTDVNFGVAGAGSLIGAAVLAFKVYGPKGATSAHDDRLDDTRTLVG